MAGKAAAAGTERILQDQVIRRQGKAASSIGTGFLFQIIILPILVLILILILQSLPSVPC